MTEPYHDPDTLQKLYVQEGLTQKEIGDRFNVHEDTIGDWVRKYGIKRPEPEKPYSDPDILRELYREKGLQLEEIAKRFDVSEATIKSWKDKHGIIRKHRDKEILKQLYIREQLSQREIAERLEVSIGAIQQWIQRHDIESEAATYMTHEGYPLWQSHGEYLQVHKLLAIHNGEDPHKVFSGREYHTHHKNGIRWANWPENIELMTHSEHMSHHHEEQWGDKPWRDKGLLWEMYVEEGFTTYEIAEEMECSAETVKRNLRKFDIPVREPNEKPEEQYVHPLRKW